MKSTLRHYGPVAMLLALILVATTLLGLWVGGDKTDAEHRVLVTTYPLYVAAQKIIGDTDGIQLTMLSAVGAGCLHDYQLTPSDRLALERADLVITNGIGEEPFLEGVAPERVVKAGEPITDLLCADHHHEGEEHHHEESYNEHVWLSPARYIQQVGVVSNALMQRYPQQAPIYAANQADYIGAIHDTVLLKLPDLSDRPCVLFHDSLAYLAADLGLEVKLTLSAEGDSGISAEALATVERLAQQHPDLLLIYDTQYPVRYGTVDGLVPAHQVLALETAVVGDGNPDDWLSAMGRNAEKLQKLTGGDAP